jgi:hypothetical protein
MKDAIMIPVFIALFILGFAFSYVFYSIWSVALPVSVWRSEINRHLFSGIIGSIVLFSGLFMKFRSSKLLWLAFAFLLGGVANIAAFFLLSW